MQTTTIADGLRHVFTRLEAQLPPPGVQDNKSLFAAWTEVLGGAGRSEQEVMVSVMEIFASLRKLEDQIASSSILDEHLRATALNTTGQFKNLFAVSSLNTVAHAFRGSCNRNLIGSLTILGLSIKPEFSEPKLTVADVNTIKETLKEVRALLASVELPVDLRANLTRQVEVMLWWLEHPEMMSMQELFEKSMLSVIVARQMDARAGTAEAKEEAKGVFSRLGSIGAMLARLLNFSINNVDKIEHLGHAVTQAIEYNPPST